MTPTEWLTAIASAAALVAGLYVQLMRDRVKRRVSEIERLEKQLARRDKTIEDLEGREDYQRRLLLAYRDETSAMRSLLYRNNIEPPQLRRHGDLTRPLDEMVAEINGETQDQGNRE